MTYQGQTVSIQIPEPIFHRLRRMAKITHRSVEDVLTTTVSAAFPPSPDLPGDLADELAAMMMFSDEALWAATKSSLSPSQEHRMSQLTHAGGSRKLTPPEASELAHLLEAYDFSVLRRAKALAILAHRGYKIPDRADWPDSPDDA